MNVAVIRYGPPTLTLGSVYAPLDRERARYCVPLGVWMARTVAPSIGAPDVSVTMPLTADVVTP
jgi:hypothetical protein